MNTSLAAILTSALALSSPAAPIDPGFNQPVLLPSGELAVERVVNQINQEAGTELFDVTFGEDEYVDLEVSEAFDPATHQDEFDELNEALQTNGFYLQAD